MPRCILNEYRKQHLSMVTLLLKEHTFIYLPYITAGVKMGLKSDIAIGSGFSWDIPATLRKYYFIVA